MVAPTYQAIIMLRELRGAVSLGFVAPADIVERLDGIERVLKPDGATAAPPPRKGLVASRQRIAHGYDPRDHAMLTIDRLGGNVSPLGLGHALEPTWETAQASGFGSNLLTALRKSGFVVRTGHARWTITPEGLAEARRVRGEGAPS